MKWRHGDGSPCSLPPTDDDIAAAPPAAFTQYLFGHAAAECGHGNTVTYAEDQS